MRGKNQYTKKLKPRNPVENILDRIGNAEDNSVPPVPEELSENLSEESQKLRKRLKKQFGISDRPDRAIENPAALLWIDWITTLTEQKSKADTPDKSYKLTQALDRCFNNLLALTKDKLEKEIWRSPYESMDEEELDRIEAEFDSILGKSPKQLALREAN